MNARGECVQPNRSWREAQQAIGIGDTKHARHPIGQFDLDFDPWGSHLRQSNRIILQS